MPMYSRFTTLIGSKSAMDVFWGSGLRGRMGAGSDGTETGMGERETEQGHGKGHPGAMRGGDVAPAAGGSGLRGGVQRC